mgnify:CR=1 FL=1
MYVIPAIIEVVLILIIGTNQDNIDDMIEYIKLAKRICSEILKSNLDKQHIFGLLPINVLISVVANFDQALIMFKDTKEQIEMFEKHFGCVRFVFNSKVESVPSVPEVLETMEAVVEPAVTEIGDEYIFVVADEPVIARSPSEPTFTVPVPADIKYEPEDIFTLALKYDC